MPVIIRMHGLGERADLPIPASMAIAGGTAARTFSFVVLLLTRSRPRFRAVPASGG